MFYPFKHQLEISQLNDSLTQARQSLNNPSLKAQEKLAGLLILVNHVEYQAKLLLDHLAYLTYWITWREFGGDLFIKFNKANRKETLGGLVRHLEQYDFPDDEAFIKLLRQFNNQRIDIVHKVLEKKMEPDSINGFLDLFEEIFSKFNVIFESLKKKYLDQGGEA